MITINLPDVFPFLELNGWLTPRTYDTNFAIPEDRPGVYMFVTRKIRGREIEMNPLYIGSSIKLGQRLRNHNMIGRCNDFLEYITGERLVGVYIDAIYYFRYSNNHIEEEKELIRKFRPRFNKTYNH